MAIRKAIDYVPVTEAHIREGRRGSLDWCPVALAIADYFGIGNNSVRVRPDEIVIYDRKGVLRFKTSSDAVKFIERFDAGEKVEPFDCALVW